MIRSLTIFELSAWAELLIQQKFRLGNWMSPSGKLNFDISCGKKSTYLHEPMCSVSHARHFVSHPSILQAHSYDGQESRDRVEAKPQNPNHKLYVFSSSIEIDYQQLPPRHRTIALF
jgi:hypothetical protein